MKRKSLLYLGLACVLCAGVIVGMRVQSFRSDRRAQQPDEAATAVYAERFSEACKLLSTTTIAVSEVADAVSKSWIKAIALGLDSSEQIEQVFAELQQNGVSPRLDQAHQQLKEQLQTLKDVPFSFHNAFGILEQTYAAYAELYKLSLHPVGSLVIFNKKVQELQEELAKNFNRLALYMPKTDTAGLEREEQKPQLSVPQRGELTAEDAAGIVGRTEEEVREMLGAPLSEEHGETSGLTQRHYLCRGKDITVYFRNGVVSGWNE